VLSSTSPALKLGSDFLWDFVDGFLGEKSHGCRQNREQHRIKPCDRPLFHACSLMMRMEGLSASRKRGVSVS